jgi:hypothetical protein
MGLRPNFIRRAPMIVAAALLALAFAGCGSGDDIPLAYTYEEGDTHTFDVVLTMDGSVSGPGVSAEESQALQDLTVQVRESYEVVDVSDGVATVTYRVEPPTLKQGGDSVPVPGASTQEITLKIDEAGRVLEIEGMEGMLPPGLSGSSLPFDPSQFGPQTTVVYPENGVAGPGDTWTAESKTQVPGTGGQEITATSTGKLVGVNEVDGRTIAEIDFTVDVPIDLTIDLAALLEDLGLGQLMSAADANDLRFSMTMNGTESLAGTAKVDVDSGVPDSLESDLRVSLKMEVTEAPPGMLTDEEMGTVTMDITGTIVMTRVD